jgi:hypothetical protein
VSDDATVAASRAAFMQWFPYIAERLNQGSPVKSSVVVKDGEAVDICVEGRQIYGGDARQFAAGQVEAFIKKPLRVFMQRLDLSGMVSPVGERLVAKIDAAMRKQEFGETLSQPRDNPTFLIVFGLGLGHHLEELLMRTNARWLLLVEPFVEFFEHSFQVVDWVKIDKIVEDRGGGMFIIPEMDPVKVVDGLSGFMSRKGIPYADGSWVFTHYPHWAFSEARDLLHESIEFAFINRGFFEDELVMFGNSVENCAKHDFWLLEAGPHLRRPETAVVVGAGPSLDESIATLRRIRDRVVLFSAGTALRALLTNGFIPDFHCELENGTQVHDVLSEAAKLGDLSQITLIAASTVDPRVSSLFRDTIFYFRDSVSSTQILKGKHREIYATSPTCVNQAVVTASTLGFTDFVLFGTDCGVRAGGGPKHAGGTIYREVEAWQKFEKKSYGLMVEGNFGGTIWTDLIYDSSRMMLIDSIRFLGLNVQNCSDGAMIAGAQPRVPEALEITKPAVDMPALQAEIERGLHRYAPGELLAEADFGAIRQKVELLFADFDALLTELGAGKADFGATYDRVMGFLSAAKDLYGRAESIPAGSIQALPRIAMFYGFRLAEESARQRFHDFFIKEYRASSAEMAKQIYELLDRLSALVPPSPNGIMAQTGS